MILLRVLVLVLLFPFLLLARLLGWGRPSNIAHLPEGHPEMAAAIARARASLPEFRDALRHPVAGMADFALKARFPVPGGSEHCWVNELEIRGTGFLGKLANDPKDIHGLALGSTVDVAEDMVSDWAYSLDGVFAGHYTTRVLLSRMPEKTRRQAEAAFGWTKPGTSVV